MPEQVPVWAWPVLPLSDVAPGGEATTGFSVDVTFRLALIARLAGRTLDLV